MKFKQRPPAKFYTAFLRLRPGDTRDFLVLIEEDDLFETLLHDCTRLWMEQISGKFPDRILCRQAFLIRSVLVSAKHCIVHECSTPVAIAFALYLCDCVEQRVAQLDREEQNAV